MKDNDIFKFVLKMFSIVCNEFSNGFLICFETFVLESS